jgi:hypothetical protein
MFNSEEIPYDESYGIMIGSVEDIPQNGVDSPKPSPEPTRTRHIITMTECLFYTLVDIFQIPLILAKCH